MKQFFLPAMLLLLLVACAPKSQPIEYGSDMCKFCKMSIVDQQHAAEVVTQKGKVYKFDAIECMLHFKKDRSDEAFALELVNTYEEPKVLKPAGSSYYLISKNLPSPMGAYLTAFVDKTSCLEMQKVKGGEIFSWTELEEQFFKNGLPQFILN